eukprot:1140334-Pelagomonas_calceolata.AAC.2
MYFTVQRTQNNSTSYGARILAQGTCQVLAVLFSLRRESKDQLSSYAAVPNAAQGAVQVEECKREILTHGNSSSCNKSTQAIARPKLIGAPHQRAGPCLLKSKEAGIEVTVAC